MSFSWSSARRSLLLEHKIFPENVMCCVRRVRVWGGGREKSAEKEEKLKRGRLGKAKKNQYVSDKKAQILDGSSV